MDVFAYLKRIGLEVAPAPTLAGLQQLQKAHLLHVPFENLDIHWGNPIVLELDSLFKKVVQKKRGGFCYELNGLFYALLKELGFEVKMVSARVHSKEKGYGPDFDHLALLVRIDGIDCLCDVGFGEFALGPLKLQLGIPQEDPRGTFAFGAHEGAWLRVDKIEAESDLPQYVFLPIPRKLSEFEEMCRFHQSSPESHFTQKRLISLPLENGRVTLSGDVLNIKQGQAKSTQTLPDKPAFQHALETHFGFPPQRL